jgi:hypoxanthine phosphoribosyltransferase
MEVKYITEQAYKMTWDEVEGVCRDIAVEADKSFGPEIVVGIAKGGLIPAAIIASLLRAEVLSCVVSRRHRGEIVSDRPRVLATVGDGVAGQRVLLVDEMVLTGETMRMASIECTKRKARAVKTASLWALDESWKPNWYGFETSGHIMFPWDYEILSRGRFILNPSYREYLDSLEMMYPWRK